MLKGNWKEIPLGEVLTLQRGFDLPHRNRKRGPVPIVSSSGITDRHSKPMVAGPGVITGRYGTIGQVFFVQEDYWPLNTTLFVSNFKGNDPLFISFLLRTIDFQSYSGKTGVPGVNRNDLHEITVKLPPLPEQRAIAEVLSDVDALIAALDRLIAKKRAIKQGAMQQILTGKTRLPGFKEDWEIKKLEEIGTIKKGRHISKRQLSTQGKPCVLYGEIYTRYDYVADELVSFIPKEVAERATVIESGDILFAGSGETAEEIGKCFAYVGNKKAYAGGDLIVLSPTEGDSTFLGYQLNSATVREQKANLGQGVSVVHIYGSNLASIRVPFPSLPEQHAIATVLSDMDAEIAALEARRDKTRALKQGMMQQLLTGRIRLV
jgi:type I restriction enzyme, S subunit